MHFTFYFTALVAPLATLTAPTSLDTTSKALVKGQTALAKPPPCIRNNSTILPQTRKRSKAFAKADVVRMFDMAPILTGAWNHGQAV
jgi:hypothetical protein